VKKSNLCGEMDSASVTEMSTSTDKVFDSQMSRNVLAFMKKIFMIEIICIFLWDEFVYIECSQNNIMKP